MALPKGVKSPVDYRGLYSSNEIEGELTEKTMTSAQKRKDTMLKKKYDDSDMKKNMIAQYGKEEGTKIYFAKIRKEAMKEELNKDDKPFVKKLVGKLRKGSKTHAKQADDLEKAMKEDTAIESELLILDWNKDDIKFTEIETVDIIKAKPLKDAELYEGFKTRMIAKFGKKLIKNIGKVNPFTKTGAQRVTGDVIKKTTPKIKGAFDVTGTQAAQMQRSKGGIKFPVRDATSKQISKNIQTKSIINQTKKANELGMKKLSNMKGSSGKDLSKPVKVNLSKTIDFDKYIGGQKPPVKKIYGTKKPTGTFTDDLPPVKTVPLNKSQTDLMKKLGKPKKKITKKKLTQQQQQQAQKGKEKPKTDKPLQDHYDWREELGEDWQKVNRKDKTDGMSKAAVKAYRRENPGSKLKTAVTKDPKKLKKGSKSAKRRLAFCRRMKGMKKKLTSAKTSRDPDSRINKALRRWNC